jgi:hypothetical protein
VFADTLTVTINAVAKVLTRINQDSYSSEYLLREVTGEYRLRIRNSTYTDKLRANRKIDRHNFELIQLVYPVAPATIGVTKKVYAVFENEQGDALVDNAKFAAGGLAFLTEANITKMLNFES